MFKFLIEVLQYISEVLSFKCYLDDKTETFELFIGNNRTHKMKVFKIKIFAFIVASFAYKWSNLVKQVNERFTCFFVLIY